KFVYGVFPEDPIHLVTINSSEFQLDRLIAARFDDHYFVGMDNVFLSLVTQKEPEPIDLEDQNVHIFPGKTILAPAAAKLASGTDIKELGKPAGPLRQLLNLQVRVSGNQIMGHVIHIDSYGNLITNISREVFEKTWNKRP